MVRKNPAAVALGRLGGLADTPAQLAARRLNGRNGGRPRLPRACLRCGVLTLQRDARTRPWCGCQIFSRSLTFGLGALCARAWLINIRAQHTGQERPPLNPHRSEPLAGVLYGPGWANVIQLFGRPRDT